MAALRPLAELEEGDLPTMEEFLQKHYKEMSEPEMQAALSRIKNKAKERWMHRSPLPI